MTASEGLLPTVDERFLEWQEREKRKKSLFQRPTVSAPTICLSRQYGCEAYPLAVKIKELYEKISSQKWMIYDLTLVRKALEDVGFSRDVLHFKARRMPHNGSELLDFLFLPHWRPPEQAAYDLLTKHILRISRQGHAIIIGLGAVVVTHELNNCFQFRLEASLDYRIHSIMRRNNLSYAQAFAVVTTNQKRRDRFIEEYLHCHLSSSVYYNIIYNNERSSIDEIAISIVNYVDAHIKKLHAEQRDGVEKFSAA